MSDPLTYEEREQLRRWAMTGQATKLGRQLRALLNERDRLEQERDEVVRALRRAVAIVSGFAIKADSDWSDDARELRTTVRKFRNVPVFPAAHPAEEPEETPP